MKLYSADLVREGDSASAFAAGSGSSDPWTRKKLTSDFTNSTVTFNNITDGTTTLNYTPAVNTDYIIEFELLVQTTATATLPRVGVLIGTNHQYGAASVEYQSGAAARIFLEGQILTTGLNLQMPAGTAMGTTPYLVKGVIKGRSGSSTPGAIVLQFASETAATVCTVKAGSEFRYRTI